MQFLSLPWAQWVYNVVLARALVVKAAPVLWIVRRFLPLSAGVEISAPGSPYLLSYRHLGLICAAHLLQLLA